MPDDGANTSSASLNSPDALKIPSLVAQPWGWNVILNPLHPDFERVSVAEAVDVVWDGRFL